MTEHPAVASSERCGRCGAAAPADALLCPSCGALLAAYRDPATIPAGGTGSLPPANPAPEAAPAPPGPIDIPVISFAEPTPPPADHGVDAPVRPLTADAAPAVPPLPSTFDPDNDWGAPEERLPVEADWEPPAAPVSPPPVEALTAEAVEPAAAGPVDALRPEQVGGTAPAVDEPAQPIAVAGRSWAEVPPAPVPMRAAQWTGTWPPPGSRRRRRRGIVETGSVAPLLVVGAIALILGCGLVGIAGAANATALGGLGFVVAVGGLVAVVVAVLATLARRESDGG